MATSKGKKSSTTEQAKPASKFGVTTKLQRHPLSEMFSLPTSEEERLALGTHISKHKQIYPIIIHEGMVLDGWERYMSCLQQGTTPEFKEYSGPDPLEVAFGANAIRRKLNSVQKALFGAKYFIASQANGGKVTQKDAAKLASVSLQRLNELVQLIRAADGNAEAAKVLGTLNNNPDVTTTGLQQMLVNCGIVDEKEQRPTTPQPRSAGADLDEEIDGLDGADDAHVDALGGADIDDMLDDDDDEADGKKKDGAPKTTSAGARVGVSKRPHETPASVCAKNFRALTEPERADFVKFAWGMLRPAMEKCLKEGRVEWEAAGVKADAGKAALGDVAAALAKATALPKPAAETNKGKRHALVKSAKNGSAADALIGQASVPTPAAKSKKTTTAKGKPATVEATAKPATKRARKPASVDA